MSARQLLETLRRLSKVFGYLLQFNYLCTCSGVSSIQILLFLDCVYRKPLGEYACLLIQPQASEDLITAVMTP